MEIIKTKSVILFDNYANGQIRVYIVFKSYVKLACKLG